MVTTHYIHTSSFPWILEHGLLPHLVPVVISSKPPEWFENRYGGRMRFEPRLGLTPAVVALVKAGGPWGDAYLDVIAPEIHRVKEELPNHACLIAHTRDRGECFRLWAWRYLQWFYPEVDGWEQVDREYGVMDDHQVARGDDVEFLSAPVPAPDPNRTNAASSITCDVATNNQSKLF